MNILQIANKAIYPPDGGSLAILNMAKGYIKNGHKVHMLNMVTHKHINTYELVEKKYKDDLTLDGVNIDTRISLIKLIINFIAFNKPYIAQRFISRKFKERIIHLIHTETVDVIQIEGLYALQYIPFIKKSFNGKVLYRPHNLEYLIWQRNYKETRNIFKKIYFKSLYNRLIILEQKFLNTYDYIIPISETDAQIFTELGNEKPLKVAPFGIELDKFVKKYKSPMREDNPAINFIGALDWLPNQRGLLWFIQTCLPQIVKEFPNLSFNIAGRNAPKKFIKTLQHPNIIFLGEIKDAYSFLQNTGPVIVPLFSGSGMRVKIIESMALKKAIVATSIAAEGIHCKNRTNILLANNSNTFSDAIIDLLKNKEFEQSIGKNAFNFVKSQHDFVKIARDIESFIN